MGSSIGGSSLSAVLRCLPLPAPSLSTPPPPSVSLARARPSLPPLHNSWQNDENGVAKQCNFIPENYENWEKMPPLCDYISIECLGKGNKRAAHVFGFGGPGLMIGYADVLTWEFVFARHQNLKVCWASLHGLLQKE